MWTTTRLLTIHPTSPTHILPQRTTIHHLIAFRRVHQGSRPTHFRIHRIDKNWSIPAKFTRQALDKQTPDRKDTAHNVRRLLDRLAIAHPLLTMEPRPAITRISGALFPSMNLKTRLRALVALNLNNTATAISRPTGQTCQPSAACARRRLVITVRTAAVSGGSRGTPVPGILLRTFCIPLTYLRNRSHLRHQYFVWCDTHDLRSQVPRYMS